MKNNNSIKSLYLTLFVLTLINAVFSALFITFSFGSFIDIAIFIIIPAILRPKLPKGNPMPFGLKLLLISCSIHLAAIILLIISYEVGRHSNTPLNIIGLLLAVASIVLLIISSVKVYKEYAAINWIQNFNY